MNAVSCMLISGEDLHRPHNIASKRAAPPKRLLKGLHSQALQVKNKIHRYSRTGFRTRRALFVFSDQGFDTNKNMCSPELVS